MKFTFALLALPVLVAATVLPRGDGGDEHHHHDNSECSTGKQVCCNSEFEHYDHLNARQRGFLDTIFEGLDIQNALTCSDFTIIGLSGNKCNSQSVCCSHVEQNALIGIACSPINL
ncbi:hypothetical protein APHAL10511_000707 [Amanita phalloides]|nr:hypothetical protein APHAL10511_000707 [Amanita phalloides]